MALNHVHQTCFCSRCEETNCTAEDLTTPVLGFIIPLSALPSLLLIVLMTGLHYGTCCLSMPPVVDVSEDDDNTSYVSKSCCVMI